MIVLKFFNLLFKLIIRKQVIIFYLVVFRNEKRIGNDIKWCEGEMILGMLIKIGYIFVILLFNFVKKKIMYWKSLYSISCMIQLYYYQLK